MEQLKVASAYELAKELIKEKDLVNKKSYGEMAKAYLENEIKSFEEKVKAFIKATTDIAGDDMPGITELSETINEIKTSVYTSTDFDTIDTKELYNEFAENYSSQKLLKEFMNDINGISMDATSTNNTYIYHVPDTESSEHVVNLRHHFIPIVNDTVNNYRRANNLGDEELNKKFQDKIMGFGKILDNITDDDTKESIQSKILQLQQEIQSIIVSKNAIKPVLCGLDINSGIPNYIYNDKMYSEKELIAMKVLDDKQPSNPAIVGGPVMPAAINAAVPVNNQTLIPTSSMLLDNSAILNKYGILSPLYNVYINNGMDVEITETTNGLIRMLPFYIQNDQQAVGRDLYVDLNAALYNAIPKAVIPSEIVPLEDSFIIPLNEYGYPVLCNYIMGKVTKEELELVNMIPDELRSFNKIMDISSLPSDQNLKDRLIDSIMGSTATVIGDAIKADNKSRFKLKDFKDLNNYTLVSDSSVKDGILLPASKRITQTINVVKGKASLINEVKDNSPKSEKGVNDKKEETTKTTGSSKSQEVKKGKNSDK